MSDEEPAGDEGYDDLLDAIGADEGYYLESPSGNGWLPPRRLDPWTGSTALSEAELPGTGEVITYTVIHVAPPAFADSAPYALAIVDFGPVQMTGQIRGVDPGEVSIGMSVAPTVGETASGERFIAFEPPMENE